MLCVALLLPLPAAAVEVSWPRVVLNGVAFDVEVRDPERLLADNTTLSLRVDDELYHVPLSRGGAVFEELRSRGDRVRFVLEAGGRPLATHEVVIIPGWLSLLPSLIAVSVALLTRQVLLALFIALWAGAWITHGLSAGGLFAGLLESANVYIIDAVTNPDHMRIILFTVLMGGTVGLMSRAGGTRGIVDRLGRFVRTRRQTQTTTGLLGLAVFFDDYANAVIVGNTMRSVIDRMRISRAKLAYLVDSTAAPVATFMLVSTWIGFQVGLIAEGVSTIEGYDESAYSIFVNAIPYNFYPILAIVFLFMVTTSGRDFGPMLKAEVARLRDGETGSAYGETEEEAAAADHAMQPKRGIPHRARNALVPILALLCGTLLGIYLTGMASPDRADDSLREIVGNADTYSALVWASLVSCIVAAGMGISQRLLTLDEATDAMFAGMMSMMFAAVILMTVWAVTGVNEALHTSRFLVAALGDSVPPALLPVLVFVLAAAMAFATGASWGVMGIMMPLVVPLAWAVLDHHGMAGDPAHMHIFYSSVAAVLAGAVWGDHCSPLADTSILSSMSAGCDLVEHIRTQLPYALLVGVAAELLGSLPVGFGLPWWVPYLVGAPLLYLVLWRVGRRAEDIA
jgi:Na+/H+ antiporter NhaC